MYSLEDYCIFPPGGSVGRHFPWGDSEERENGFDEPFALIVFSNTWGTFGRGMPDSTQLM